MNAIPQEVFYVVLEHIWSLNDLGALWLVNRRAAWLCANILPKTMWRITYRTCARDCDCQEDENENENEMECLSVTSDAVDEPGSVPFKVRAWLYRRASVRSFGTSEEALGRCVVLGDKYLENPYDMIHGSGKLSTGCEEDDDSRAEEWDKLWSIFRRHLVMQRVQRVILGDGTVRPEWSRSYELLKDVRRWLKLCEKRTVYEDRLR